MSSADLSVHLATGVTRSCHCWKVARQDGQCFGFTDHDRPLGFEDMTFAPQSGLSARALASTSGLSVNNASALGVLSDDAITEADIMAGRYDAAEVTVWLVRWDDVSARQIQFRGTIGEITRSAGGFEAELHGLTEPLNQPIGRSYLKSCDAVLGDGRCGVALGDAAYVHEFVLDAEVSGTAIVITAPDFADGWFTHGLCEVLSGASRGLRVAIKDDVTDGDTRRVTLWSAFGQPLGKGDRLRIVAGCDKAAATCRTKFANFLNFQGFPDIPGEDWLVAVPRSGGTNTGGSLIR